MINSQNLLLQPCTLSCTLPGLALWRTRCKCKPTQGKGHRGSGARKNWESRPFWWDFGFFTEKIQWILNVQLLLSRHWTYWGRGRFNKRQDAHFDPTLVAPRECVIALWIRNVFSRKYVLETKEVIVDHDEQEIQKRLCNWLELQSRDRLARGKPWMI